MDFGCCPAELGLVFVDSTGVCAVQMQDLIACQRTDRSMDMGEFEFTEDKED